ncbi:MAG: DUF1638 domain-containing protein, partial [Proteobacteria bacterium]|nr:DUF1638 domain-containing protein [Pseudomonadota bacterium]
CEAYRTAIKKRPGTFYLTSGWIEDRKDPLGYMEDKYIPRMGRETAEWGMKEELKHYSHFVLINTGVGDLDRMRRQTLENAKFFGKEYEEIPGSLALLRKMIMEPLRNKDFIFIEPGGSIRQNMFLSLGGKAFPDQINLDSDPASLRPPVQFEPGRPGKESSGSLP